MQGGAHANQSPANPDWGNALTHPDDRNYGYGPLNQDFGLAQDASGFNPLHYLQILSKYRWLIATVIITSLLVGAGVTFLMTPIYRSTAAIQIDRETVSVVKVDGFEPQEGQGGIEFYQTQYALLASRSLAERVATKLGLVQNASFMEDKAGPHDRLLELVLGKDTKEEAAAEKTQEELARLATDKLLKTLTVSPISGSRIVRLSIDNAHPELAQEIANGYAEVFITDSLDRRFESTTYARKFLEDRLQQLKLKLEDSERQLVAYAQEKGIIKLDGEKNLSVTTLEAVNAQLTEARSERIKRELLWKQASQSTGLGMKEFLESEAIQENRKLRTELAAQYQQKLAVFKPAFPEMVQLRNQIKELDRQVQTEVNAIKESIKVAFLAAKEEEDRLAQQLEESKSENSELRNSSIEYNILQREVDTNRTLYDGLLQRYKEIGVAGGVGTNNISIVDKGQMPILPRSPNLFLNLGIAFALGLIASVLLALFLDHVDDTFMLPEDIEKELGVPAIGVVPKPRSAGKIEDELRDSRSPLSEAFRSLRTGLQFSTQEGLPRSLLVTSSQPSEGKTTTTINTAKLFADIGLSVLLIDCDLRNASVHQRMVCSNAIGLSNYLAGTHAPEDVVQSTSQPGLTLMSAGPLPANPAEMLNSARLGSLVTLACSSFDLVILDGPPIMGLADALLLANSVHATVMVVAANDTRVNTVKIALKRLRQTRANVIGAVLTKFEPKGWGYGYGEYGYYGKDDTPRLEHQA